MTPTVILPKDREDWLSLRAPNINSTRRKHVKRGSDENR